MTKRTENYKQAVSALVEEFVAKYYTDDGYLPDYYLIGESKGKVGGPLCVNDEHYYSIDEVYEALVNNFTLDKLEARQELILETEGKPGINFFNRCMYGGHKKYSEEELEESRKNVEYAKKLLDDEIDKYNG